MSLRRGLRRLGLLLLPCLALGWGGCREEGGPEPLRVICEATFPPYEYHVQGAIDGIDPALCAIFAACLGRPLEVQDMAFDAVIPAVATGKADLAASGITVTEARARQVRFSAPYVEAAQVAVVPIAGAARDLEDLPGLRLGVQSGSTGDLFVTRAYGEPDRYKSVIEALNAVRMGKVEAAVVDRQPAQAFIAQTPGLRLLPRPVVREAYAFAVNPADPRLAAQVDAILAHLRRAGHLEEVARRYLEANGGATPTAPVDTADIREAVAADPMLRAELARLAADPALDPPRRTLGDALRGLADTFRANFVDEGRWRYLAEGLRATLVISALATLLGLLIGFGVAVVRATHDMAGTLALPNALCRLYLTVVRGTPVVVQLLIIYFVIFGSQDVSKVFVAVVAFGLNSGAYVAEIVRGGIMAIDRGQNEAGRSLGLGHWRTMGFVILPQALRNVLPALGNEFIVLLKETSVAGYIALMDLTKAGDVIRSQTYTAFMPLLAVAAIYLAIVSLFTWLLGRLERRLKRDA